jgi:hypothetical protein
MDPLHDGHHDYDKLTQLTPVLANLLREILSDIESNLQG